MRKMRDDRFVKVYAHDTCRVLSIGWEGRALLWELLRKADRYGFIETKRRNAHVLSVYTNIPLDVVERALPVLLHDGCVAEVDCGYEVFVEPRVYFLRAETPDGAIVKIGTSRGPVSKRIRSIATMSPIPVDLIGSISAEDRSEESRWHKRFADYRCHGEWFRWDDNISSAIYSEIERRGTWRA